MSTYNFRFATATITHNALSMTGDARAETITVSERIELARLELEAKKVVLQTEQVKVEADPRTKMIEVFESLCSKESTEINAVTMKIATNAVVVDIAKIAIASSIRASKDRMENAVAFLTELECNRLEEKKMEAFLHMTDEDRKAQQQVAMNNMEIVKYNTELAKQIVTNNSELAKGTMDSVVEANTKNLESFAKLASEDHATAYTNASKNRDDTTELVEEGGGKRRKIAHSTTEPANGA